MNRTVFGCAYRGDRYLEDPAEDEDLNLKQRLREGPAPFLVAWPLGYLGLEVQCGGIRPRAEGGWVCEG